MGIRRTILYTGLSFMVVAGSLSSCLKVEDTSAALSDTYIVMDTSEDDSFTKAMLGNGDLTTNGTVFQTYDYISGYTGTISGHSNGEQFQYFSNTLTYKSDATPWTWLFGNTSSPDSYRWTRTGTHRFFGWMLTDGHDASSLTTSSCFSTYNTNFDETNGVHTVNLGTNLTVDSRQYDFLYSDIKSVAVADGVPDKVPLHMNHLFGALGVTVSNDSDLDVKVYGISFQNFPSTNDNVSIAYGDLTGDVNLNYNQPTYSSSSVYFPNKIPNSGITLYNRDHALAGKTYDAVTGNEMTSADPSYYLAWPVLRSVLEPSGTTYDVDGNPVYASNAPLIVVDCKVGTQDRKTIKIKFPGASSENPWFIAAGKKTKLDLQFLNKQISLSFTIKDWQFEQYPMSYENDAISATQLKFTLNTYIDGGTERINGVKHAVIKLTSSSTAGSYIATGSFKVFTPVNGVLTVGLGGNADDFAVSLQSGDATSGGTESITINPSRDGGKITLSIRPVGTPAHGSRCFLHFGVRNNGRDSEADSEINRDGYIVVFP